MSVDDASPVRKRPGFRLILQDVSAGAVAGIVALSNTITFGVLIFSGALQENVSLGIGLALFSGFALALTITLLTRAVGIIAFPQSAVAPILALLAAEIAAGMQDKASGETILMTVVAALWLTTILTGLIALGLGRFRLGGLIRFMPYPVFGGFLAGLGWLMFRGGIAVMTDGVVDISVLVDQQALLRWLPGVFYGVVMLVVQRRFKHPLVVPIMLVSGWGLFFLAVRGLHLPLAEMTAQGWFLGPFPAGWLWRPVVIPALGQADWGAILPHTGTILTVVMTALLGSLLNFSGIELATRQSVDLDKNLEAAGIGNLVASLGGGMVGYQSASISIMAHKAGARTRLAGLVAALFFGVSLLGGASLLSILPKMVVGGVLVYLGLSFLIRWVYDTWFTLPLPDYLTLLLILIVIAVVGLLQGVGLGLVLMVALFVVNYSRIDVVRHALSGANFRSHVDRPSKHQRVLQQEGGSVLILKLQGYIFFGTASRLLIDVQRRAEDPRLLPLKFAVLDFYMINGIDSSALSSFTQMERYAESKGVTLVFTGLTEELRAVVARGIDDEYEDKMRFFPDLDRGVEWCEDQTLQDSGVTQVPDGRLPSQLEAIFRNMRKVKRFMEYLERAEVPEDYGLIQQNDPPSGLYFIERGKVTARLELEDGSTIRLRTMGAGTIVGELGIYLMHPATATVVTDEPSVIYTLSMTQLEKMEEASPDIASDFHRYIATILGERLADNNHTMRALLE